jgi:hypothetical protein
MKTNIHGLLFVMALLLLLPACHWFGIDDDDEVSVENPGQFILLQIDYQTLAFEGGKTFDIEGAAPSIDSLPVFIDYQPPGDFGDLGLYSSLDSSQLFFGTIVWAGRGDRIFPAQLDDPTTFETTDDIPEILPFIKDLNPQPQPTLVEMIDLWNAVSNLSIMVDAVTTSGAHFGWVFYPRSVGIGDPADWDYYLVAYVPEG